MAPLWSELELDPGEDYWSMATQRLRRWNAPAGGDEHQVSRMHRRIVQLNVHQQQNLDFNMLTVGSVVRVPKTNALLNHGHVGDGQVLTQEEVIHRLRSAGPGETVALRGTRVTGDLRLDAVEVAGNVCLADARIDGSVSLTHCRLAGFLCLERARVAGQLEMRETVVDGDLSFDHAEVTWPLTVAGVQGSGSVSLDGLGAGDAVHLRLDRDGAVYLGAVTGAPKGVYLSQCRVGAGIYAYGARLTGRLELNSCRTEHQLALTDTAVSGALEVTACHSPAIRLPAADVGGKASLTEAATRLLDLRNVSAQKGLRIGMPDIGTLLLDGTRVTGGLVSIRAGEAAISADDVEWAQGGEVELAHGEVRFEAARFPGGTVLRGTSEWSRPRLLSVRGSRLTGLALVNVDLTETLFAGASDLDKLRLESDIGWPRAPRIRGRGGSRAVLREEAIVRTADGSRSWKGLAGDVDVQSSLRAMPSAGEVAEIYRGLRKGMEDRKNEPEAADFYYGEMQMRRRATRSPAEKVLLTLYWLLSGYGLRAWRALTALALLIAASTAVMALWGFQGRSVESWGDLRRNLLPALTYSAESAVVVFRGADQLLPTLPGRWCQIVLRVFGPALLALAVLAIRGRVKR